MQFGLLAVTTILFALAVPFGTFQAGAFTDRLIYWFVLNYLSIFWAASTKGLATKHLNNWSFLSNESLVIVMIRLLFTPFLWFWTLSMFPGLITGLPTMILMGGIDDHFYCYPTAKGFPLAENTNLILRFWVSFKGGVFGT